MTSLAARISALTDRELRGWWWCVVLEKIRDERPGERALLLDRARVLGVDLVAG